VTSVTTPAPGTGDPAQTTSTDYDELGRPKRIVYPDGASLTNAQTAMGSSAQTAMGSSISI
jgi:YD repeat-containing protein